MVTDSCYISNKVFTKCFFIFRSSVIIMWARQSASCLKAASWPFNVTQGHLLKSGPSSSCLSWESNVFSNFIPLWMIPVGLPQRIGRTGVKGLLFCEMNQVHCYFSSQTPDNVSTNESDSPNSPAHCLFTPDSSLCSSPFAGWIFLVWYRGKSFKYTQLCFVEGLSFSVSFLKRGVLVFSTTSIVLHSFGFYIHAQFIFFKVGKSSQHFYQ